MRIVLKVTDIIPGNLLGTGEGGGEAISPSSKPPRELPSNTPAQPSHPVLPNVHTSSPSLLMNGGLMNGSR